MHQPQYDLPPEAKAAPEAAIPEAAAPVPPAPLWEGVTGPLSFEEWQKRRRRMEPLYKWLWWTLFYSAIQIMLASSNVFFYVGDQVAHAVALFPINLALIILALTAFGLGNRRRKKADRAAFDCYMRNERNGRRVRVFADRIEAVGVDTVTIFLPDAQLWESRDTIMVEKDSLFVAVRSQDVTPEQAYALCCALYGKTAKHYGEEPLVGGRVQRFTPVGQGYFVPQPLPPLPQPPTSEQPQFTTHFMPTGTIAKRKAGARVLRGLWVWLPPFLLPTFTLACTLGNAYNVLYIYIGIILGVFALAMLLAILGLVLGSRYQKTPIPMRFYSDRLVIEAEGEVISFPQSLLRLYLTPQELMMETPDSVYSLPLDRFADAAAMRAFVAPTAVDRHEQVNTSAATVSPDGVDKEQE